MQEGESVEGYRYHVGREDGPAWKIDRYDPKIRFIDGQGVEQMLDHEEARAKLASFGKSINQFLSWLK